MRTHYTNKQNRAKMGYCRRDPEKRAMRAARQGTKNRLRAALSQPLWPWPLGVGGHKERVYSI